MSPLPLCIRAMRALQLAPMSNRQLSQVLSCPSRTIYTVTWRLRQRDKIYVLRREATATTRRGGPRECVFALTMRRKT